MAWLLFVERRDREATRTNLALLGSGLAAALPAFLIGGAPVRDNLAYVIAGYNIPDDSSWSYVASGYLDQLWRTISTDATYPLDFPAPVAVVLYAGLALALAALVAVVARPSRGDPYFSLMKAAHPGLRAAAAARQQPAGVPAGAGVRADRGGRARGPRHAT